MKYLDDMMDELRAHLTPPADLTETPRRNKAMAEERRQFSSKAPARAPVRASSSADVIVGPDLHVRAPARSLTCCLELGPFGPMGEGTLPQPSGCGCGRLSR